jgi:hypothetical protein
MRRLGGFVLVTALASSPDGAALIGRMPTGPGLALFRDRDRFMLVANFAEDAAVGLASRSPVI